MTSPQERKAARAYEESRAVSDTAHLLRQLARHDAQSDAGRGYLSFALAGLVEAVGRQYRALPDEVAHQARRVAEAADRATGQRRE